MTGTKTGGRVRLVAFDMDGVLIDHVSSWAAVHDALGTHNADAVAAFLAGAIDDREFIRRDVERWKRAQPAFTRQQMRSILERVPRMPGMREAVAAVRATGATCAIISGGLRTMAEIVAAEAGFDHVRANDVVFGPDGWLADGCVIEVPMWEKAGVLAALQTQLGVPPAETAAIGDSRFDRGLFERSRVAIAFNPLDAEVERTATHVVREKDLRKAVAPILEGSKQPR